MFDEYKFLQARHEAYPDLFEAPTWRDRVRIGVGQLVVTIVAGLIVYVLVECHK